MTIRTCRHCKAKFDIETNRFRADGRKYYHLECFKKIHAAAVLGIAVEQPKNLPESPARVRNTEIKEKLLDFCQKELHMTRRATTQKLGFCVKDGLSVEEMWNAVRYLKEVAGIKFEPYEFWRVERAVPTARKYYRELARINASNAGKLQKMSLTGDEEQYAVTLRPSVPNIRLKFQEMD